MGGVVNGVQAAYPAMIRQGFGHIVNTASMAGLLNAPTMGVYNVSKHAVVTLSECLYHDLAARGGKALGNFVSDALAGHKPFVLVLDSLEDPQNVGTLLRSAEAAGPFPSPEAP